jgi:hypothetical protein
MCFVPPTAPPASSHRSPTVAILHIDPHLERQLVVRRFDLIEKELSIDDTHVLPAVVVHSHASLLVPVTGVGDGDDGGILVIGGGSCEYICCSPLKHSASVTLGKQPKDFKGKATSPVLARKKRVRESSTASLTGENKSLKIDIPLDDVTA